MQENGVLGQRRRSILDMGGDYSERDREHEMTSPRADTRSMTETEVGEDVSAQDLVLIGAPTPHPANVPCLDTTSRVRRCFDLMAFFADTCDRCLLQYFPESVATCEELNTVMCEIIGKCPCGLCRKHIAAFLDCAFEKLVDCPVNCGDQFETISVTDGESEPHSQGH